MKYLVAITSVFLGASLASGQWKGNRPPQLQVGQWAPTFTLQSLDGRDAFSLLDQRGKKPVVLFFGSYT